MNTSQQQIEEQGTKYDRTYTEDDFLNDLDPMLEGGAFKVAFNR